MKKKEMRNLSGVAESFENENANLMSIWYFIFLSVFKSNLETLEFMRSWGGRRGFKAIYY